LIALLVKFEVIRSLDDSYSAETLATGLQDFLICIEMMIVSIAHLYTFSYLPFVETGSEGIDGSSSNGYIAVGQEEVHSSRSYNKNTTNANISSSNNNSRSKMRSRSSDKRQLLGYAQVDNINGKDDDIDDDDNSGDNGDKGPHSRAESLKPLSIRSQYGYKPPSSHTNTTGSNNNSSYYTSSSSMSNQTPSSSPSVSSTAAYNALHNQSVETHYHDTLRAPDLSGTSLRTTLLTTSNSNGNIPGNNNSNNSNNNRNLALSQFDVERDLSSGQHKRSTVSTTATAATRSVTEVLNRHFASSSAVRDFNEAMPVVVLPSNFKPAKGVVIDSDPSERLRQYRENNDNSP